MALTYDQSLALMNDSSFRGRVMVACLKFADSIVIEAGNTPAHTSRLKWANTCNYNPDQTAGLVQRPVVIDGAVQSAGSSITDDALQGAVEVVVQKDFI